VVFVVYFELPSASLALMPMILFVESKLPACCRHRFKICLPSDPPAQAAYPARAAYSEHLLSALHLRKLTSTSMPEICSLEIPKTRN